MDFHANRAWKTWNLKDLKAPPQQLNTSGEITRRVVRGSIELVIPTANFTPEVVESLPEFLLPSVWANVADGPVLKIVLNAG
ncbi:putative riboflavin kinase [Drosophila pseudoobscura]|uniref:Riboflavin kinase n=1 Tax=Drosophila pseudoobscura pseudoobscura TaxID=46245 RepID=A0A6I8UYR2_DROPS|nr:putative riboflavin kinase [Drosophila pseudoobscura]